MIKSEEREPCECIKHSYIFTRKVSVKTQEERFNATEIPRRQKFTASCRLAIFKKHDSYKNIKKVITVEEEIFKTKILKKGKFSPILVTIFGSLNVLGMFFFWFQEHSRKICLLVL